MGVNEYLDCRLTKAPVWVGRLLFRFFYCFRFIYSSWKSYKAWRSFQGTLNLIIIMLSEFNVLV